MNLNLVTYLCSVCGRETLQKGDVHRKTPLAIAAYNDKEEVVEVLLRYNVDVSPKALQHAASFEIKSMLAQRLHGRELKRPPQNILFSMFDGFLSSEITGMVIAGLPLMCALWLLCMAAELGAGFKALKILYCSWSFLCILISCVLIPDYMHGRGFFS